MSTHVRASMYLQQWQWSHMASVDCHCPWPCRRSHDVCRGSAHWWIRQETLGPQCAQDCNRIDVYPSPYIMGRFYLFFSGCPASVRWTEDKADLYRVTPPGYPDLPRYRPVMRDRGRGGQSGVTQRCNPVQIKWPAALSIGDIYTAP